MPGRGQTVGQGAIEFGITLGEIVVPLRIITRIDDFRSRGHGIARDGFAQLRMEVGDYLGIEANLVAWPTRLRVREIGQHDAVGAAALRGLAPAIGEPVAIDWVLDPRWPFAFRQTHERTDM